MWKISVTKYDNKKFGGNFKELEKANSWINNQKRKNTWGKPEREVIYNKHQAHDPRAEVLEEYTDGRVKCRIPCDYEIEIREVEGFEEAEQMFLKLRNERLELLKDTDKTQLPDYPLDSSDKRYWREYRQYLRDLPKHYDNVSIYRFKIMDFTTWKRWKHNK